MVINSPTVRSDIQGHLVDCKYGKPARLRAVRYSRDRGTRHRQRVMSSGTGILPVTS